MRLVLLAAVLAMQAPAPAAAATSGSEPVAELIRVAANTGTAAGGHVALRLGERVYHYQVGGDGLLWLARDAWPTFRIHYNVLENRGLELHRLGIDPDAFRRIERRMARLHAVQSIQLARLEALELERRWIEALGTEAGTVPLPAVGLFSREAGRDPGARRLRGAIEARYGPGFFRTELAGVEDALREGALRVSKLGGRLPAPGVLPEVHQIEAERRRSLLMLREALLALDEGWTLASEAWFEPDAGADLDLSEDEREALALQQAELEASLLRLLDSHRADRGEPLLLALARHRTVDRSLARGRLVLLDPIPGDAARLDARALRDQRETLEPLWRAARRAYLDARALALGGGFDELRHNHLAAMASLAAGLEAALAGEGRVRLWVGGSSLPFRSGAVSLPRVAIPPGWRDDALARARAHETRERAPHEYELLTRNCSTELAASVVSAFPDEEQAAHALGGRLDPDAARNFYPAAFVRAARRTWSVRETRELPSWRKQLVADFEGRENPLLVRLRESNTWTSRAYQGSFRDAPFVFFTDGLVWIRPFQGVINVGYGLGHAALGTLSLPADGGRRALAGLRGAFFSAPELVGVNIRKGRYDLPPAAVAEQTR